jgi:dCTP diphosphatase
MDLEKMKESYRLFIKERKWERFQSPKNLSMALAVEASELLELFQWLTEEQSYAPKELQAVKDEMADVFSYLIILSDCLKIDLNEVFWEKMGKNRKKYPPDSLQDLSKKTFVH